MNKDFKNGIIGLLMFMGIILLLGFVETTIEDGKKSSYSSNRSSYSYTKSTSSYTSGSSQARLHLQAASQEVVQVRLAAQAVHQK